MMSTLFIGPPDWVFRWEEHRPMFIGLIIGMLLAGVAVYYVMTKIRQRHGVVVAPYEAVVMMNEMKSKALD
jgi:CBS-domain-containing membrane protein